MMALSGTADSSISAFTLTFGVRALLAAFLAAGVGGCDDALWRTTIAPASQPAAGSFSPDIVAKGEVLAGAGNCAACHTVRDGQPYAGGYAMQTGFGTLYSTNITPDLETGIGAWSEEAFRRAMHEGVARDGSQLFPAFPFDHFTKLSDADVSALYAYFMTRKPIHATIPDNTIPFPLNVRALQAGWKLLFFRSGRFAEEPGQGAEWNRGAYLAEGISHCGACHTPRNFLGAEQHDHRYAGAPIDHWVAPPLTKANPSPLPWSQDEWFAYLRTGLSGFHGSAVGPMSSVVHDGLSKLPDADIHALAVYFADISDATAHAGEAQPAIQKALAIDSSDTGHSYNRSARLYAQACASCHYNSGSINPYRADLTLNSAAGLADPNNLIQVVLFGINARQGTSAKLMPAFAAGFSDFDIAQIAAYIRATRTSEAPWPELTEKVAALRAAGNGHE